MKISIAFPVKSAFKLKMLNKFIFLFLSLMTVGNLFAQSQYLGYREDCIELQSIKIDSIFMAEIGISRYTKLIELVQYHQENKVKVLIGIDSLGLAREFYFFDKMVFLTLEEKEKITNAISKTNFAICIEAIEARSLSYHDLFKENKVITYGVFLPFEK